MGGPFAGPELVFTALPLGDAVSATGEAIHGGFL